MSRDTAKGTSWHVLSESNMSTLRVAKVPLFLEAES